MALPLTSTQQSKSYRSSQTVQNLDLEVFSCLVWISNLNLSKYVKHEIAGVLPPGFPAVLMHACVHWLKTEE